MEEEKEIPHFCYRWERSWVWLHLVHGSIGDFLGLLLSQYTIQPLLEVMQTHVNVLVFCLFFWERWQCQLYSQYCIKKGKKTVVFSAWQTSALMMMPLLKLHATSFFITTISVQGLWYYLLFILEELTSEINWQILFRIFAWFWINNDFVNSKAIM